MTRICPNSDAVRVMYANVNTINDITSDMTEGFFSLNPTKNGC